MFEYVLFSIPKIGIQAGVHFFRKPLPISPHPFADILLSCRNRHFSLLHPKCLLVKTPGFSLITSQTFASETQKKTFVDDFSHENLHL